YPFPNLVGGTMLLCLVDLLWRDVLESGLLAGVVWRGVGTLAALVTLLVMARTLAAGRSVGGYRDTPAAALAVTPGDSSAGLGSIRTNPGTAASLRQLAACVREHPASRVAVIPDNPFVYPAMGLRNPLPIDWLWPAEVVGSERQLIEGARRLGEAGD